MKREARILRTDERPSQWLRNLDMLCRFTLTDQARQEVYDAISQMACMLKLSHDYLDYDEELKLDELIKEYELDVPDDLCETFGV
ncbi:hypothetical protein OKZ58_004654 [Vibrio alginolyticus]|nr:hypothetical protein [Vibrio alginolyticus]